MVNCKLVYLTREHHLQSKTTRLDDVNNTDEENEQSPAERKSSVAASTPWKVSEKDELGPECRSDLPLDDSDSDPDFIPLLKKKRKKTFNLNPTGAGSTSSTNLSNSAPAEIINNTTQPSMSSNSTQVIETTKERSYEQTKPKRKKRNSSAWARNKRKQLRNSGQAYMTSRGKKAEARQMTDCCSTSCVDICVMPTLGLRTEIGSLSKTQCSVQYAN